MYTEEFKRAAVQKAELRGSRPLGGVARDLGVTAPTLNEWRKRASMGNMGKQRQGKRSLGDKQEILLKTAAMPEKELGEYLRGEGLHTADLERWKAEIVDHLRGPSRAERSRENKLRLENVSLARQLHRKDKALAETAAILVLQKKVGLLLGRTGPEVEE